MSRFARQSYCSRFSNLFSTLFSIVKRFKGVLISDCQRRTMLLFPEFAMAESGRT